MTKQANMLSASMQYASRGFSVMPVGKDKRPLLSSWKTLQTTPANEEQIEKWWTKNPTTNIGIITGKVSNIIVIDVDTYKGAKDIFPATFTVQTGNGGLQKYYHYVPGFTVSANGYPNMPHVDIRADGGYVVAAPSITSYKGKDGTKAGGQYTIINDIPLVPFPAHLFPQAKEKALSVDKVLKGFNTMADGDGRNNAITKVIGKIINLVPRADYESVAWPMALAANKQFKKPLDEAEVRICFDSISKKENSKPLASIEFLRTDKGVIIANIENVYRTIRSDNALRGHFRLNTFAGSLESNFKKHEWESYQKVDIINVQRHLMSTYPHFTKIPYEMVESAVISEAEHNRVSPPKAWLESLTWDKTPRLDTWLSSTYNVADNAYHNAVGANWLKGVVKRLVFPGCKFDYVLVLEGPQGIGKSTSLAILGGAWHVETVFSPDNKDFFMLFAGNAIVEFSEGESLSRTETKKLKAVITMAHDKYRPPYDRSVRDFPRQCVFAMTTNQAQYLKDETGNRRWLPVAIEEKINNEWLRDNRDQLYAEAYERVVTNSETTHEFPDEETREQQSLRQITDPNEETVVEWYYNVLTNEERYKGITTRMVYLGAIHGGFGGGKPMDKRDEMIIAPILRSVLKLEMKRSMVKGTRVNLFYPTVESEANKADSVAAVTKSMSF